MQRETFSRPIALPAMLKGIVAACLFLSLSPVLISGLNQRPYLSGASLQPSGFSQDMKELSSSVPFSEGEVNELLTPDTEAADQYTDRSGSLFPEDALDAEEVEGEQVTPDTDGLIHSVDSQTSTFLESRSNTRGAEGGDERSGAGDPGEGTSSGGVRTRSMTRAQSLGEVELSGVFLEAQRTCPDFRYIWGAMQKFNDSNSAKHLSALLSSRHITLQTSLEALSSLPLGLQVHAGMALALEKLLRPAAHFDSSKWIFTAEGASAALPPEQARAVRAFEEEIQRVGQGSKGAMAKLAEAWKIDFSKFVDTMRPVFPVLGAALENALAGATEEIQARKSLREAAKHLSSLLEEFSTRSGHLGVMKLLVDVIKNEQACELIDLAWYRAAAEEGLKLLKTCEGRSLWRKVQWGKALAAAYKKLMYAESLVGNDIVEECQAYVQRGAPKDSSVFPWFYPVSGLFPKNYAVVSARSGGAPLRESREWITG